MGSCPADLEAAELIAVNQDVGQVVFKNQVKQCFAWLSMAPAVPFAVSNDEASGFGCLLETLVVIRPAAAAILDAVLVVPVMAHLMQERRADVFNWAGKRPSTDIDLMC